MDFKKILKESIKDALIILTPALAKLTVTAVDVAVVSSVDKFKGRNKKNSPVSTTVNESLKTQSGKKGHPKVILGDNEEYKKQYLRDKIRRGKYLPADE